MGQCSALPNEARNENTNSHHNTFSKPNERDPPPTSTNAYNVTHQLSENANTPLNRRHGYHDVQTINQHFPAPIAQFSHMAVHQEQHPASPQHRQQMGTSYAPSDQGRDDCPPPPETAIRTRCYKLNLESDFVGFTSASSAEGHLLGPFDGNLPPLTYSGSDDSSTGQNSTDVAIQTAQIFRGITVAKDGTILSQNARATRSNKGKKNQKGEQSRQAAKIDQAKDLVEGSLITGKGPGTDDTAHMVSLVIMGEYDDMKYLVRDGAKKLRDATGLPDGALLAVNRSRSQLLFSPMSPSRKRVSPYAPSSPQFNSPPKSPKSRHLPQSAPPKMESAPPKINTNPRDNRPNSRRFSEDNRAGSHRFLPMADPCNPSGDSDWTSTLGLSKGFNSIWNCGVEGTSPVQMNRQQQADYEYARMVNARMEPEGREPAHVVRA